MKRNTTGAMIRRLRLEKEMTQNDLAKRLYVTVQAVSKWERDKGLPDHSYLVRLSQILQINLKELLEGSVKENKEGDSMKEIHFYVCPLCSNILFSTGGGELNCCGRPLEELPASEASEKQRMKIGKVEYDWYISSDHPMTKKDYISFTALFTGGQVTVTKHYPQWNLELRVPRRGKETLYWYSEKAGLLYQKLI